MGGSLLLAVPCRVPEDNPFCLPCLEKGCHPQLVGTPWRPVKQCPCCPWTDPGTVCRRQNKGTKCLLPQGANSKAMAIPPSWAATLHAMANAILSGHEMWHLVTRAARGAEPSDNCPPRPPSDSSQSEFGVHMTFPGCCHPGAAGAGHCPPLPAGSRVPAQLPWPQSHLLPQTFHQSAFSPQELISRGDKSRKIVSLMTSQLPDPGTRLSPHSVALSLTSAGWAPAVPALSGLVQALCPSQLPCKQQCKQTGAGSC